MLTNFNELSNLPVGSVIRDDDGVFQIDTFEDSEDRVIFTPGCATAFSLRSVKFPADVLYIPFD